MKFIYLTYYYSGARVMVNIDDVRICETQPDEEKPGETKTVLIFKDTRSIQVRETLGAIGDLT
jgi:hypothetical protein